MAASTDTREGAQAGWGWSSKRIWISPVVLQQNALGQQGYTMQSDYAMTAAVNLADGSKVGWLEFFSFSFFFL